MRTNDQFIVSENIFPFWDSTGIQAIKK